MIFAHTGRDGFWVATAEEAAKYLGYQANHFGPGFMIGRWTGVYMTSTFQTLDEAIAAEHLVPDRKVERSNPSNALDRHNAALTNDD